MNEFLNTIGPGGIVLLFLALLISLVQLFRRIVKKKSSSSTSNQHHLVKKYDDVNLNRYTGFFRLLGLSIAMLTVLAAFEYPVINKALITPENIDRVIGNEHYDSVLTIEIIKPKPQPRPRVIPDKIEVTDDPTIEDIIFDNNEFDPDAEIPDEPIEDDLSPDEEVSDEPLIIVEQTAEFKGGLGKFYKFLGKKLKYPRMAKQMHIEGKVFVEFIVERDGTLTDIRVSRGIGGGCDEEAIRVLKESPAWQPARQRGRVVRQRMVIPIYFKLN
ncbi:energy transducer TonB [Flammeovirga sp. SubArs3]|uniref:energy transducer TonB n=1 Tax=Flammeovirga sp. SubArs3 TaxID=2995316 RepID=UPI00248C0402|nr:energy transducer TonB [Flammeovirga sp. SubArs3]